MKHTILSFTLLLFVVLTARSNALLIVDAPGKTVLQLESSVISAEVVNQVATVISTQTFTNQLDSAVHVKYAFPMYEDAYAVGLRWKIYGTWYSADFTPQLPDTSLSNSSGQASHPDIIAYLGATPLFFVLNQAIEVDSSVVFELTYVQLLHYAFNTVTFQHPNDYSLFQTGPVSYQSFSFHGYSDRTIVGIDIPSHPNASKSYSSTDAYADNELFNEPADEDYYLEYTLDPQELGLFGFSTFLPDSMNECDTLGNGFFCLIVEPDPGDSVIIQKVFTLIIDRSGSMSGDKIVQARDAASYIVDNLNAGDKFNIIDFDDQITSLFPDHVDVNVSNQNTALNYISTLTADGSTNISGAFSTAIPQFANSDPDVANIIIFMTDGQPSAGLTNTQDILNLIQNLVTSYSVQGISINSFGIGYDVNESLLSQIATQNNGIAEFFSAGNLLPVVTSFYSSIQSPVLLGTSITFDPPVVSEIYPNPLPNLYKGYQLIAVGRYDQPGSENVSFTGLKYGDTVTYNYSFTLTDSVIESNLFLTKLWAIEKINNLMTEYYTLNSSSQQATDLKNFIINLSLCYGVISPFTSFYDNSGGGAQVYVEEVESASGTRKIEAFPNPFRESTFIRFQSPVDLFKIIPCVILDAKGSIVTILEIFAGASGEYKIVWDGKDSSGHEVTAGIYPFYIQIGSQQFYGIVEKL